MTLKPALAIFLALSLGAAGAARAQFVDDADWAESAVPPPPAFDLAKLVTFDGGGASSLVYGVDPASIQISKSDSLVRYVLVATSASGARNIMYEAIRCAKGEFKTYGRYTPDGRWVMAEQPEWRSMFGNMPSRHALLFAKAGACDNAAPATSVNALVARLRTPSGRIGNNHD